MSCRIGTLFDLIHHNHLLEIGRAEGLSQSELDHLNSVSQIVNFSPSHLVLDLYLLILRDELEIFSEPLDPPSQPTMPPPRKATAVFPSTDPPEASVNRRIAGQWERHFGDDCILTSQASSSRPRFKPLHSTSSATHRSHDFLHQSPYRLPNHNRGQLTGQQVLFGNALRGITKSVKQSHSIQGAAAKYENENKTDGLLEKGKERANGSPGCHIDLTAEEENEKQHRVGRSTDQDVVEECLEQCRLTASQSNHKYPDDSANEESDDPMLLSKPPTKLKRIEGMRGRDNKVRHESSDLPHHKVTSFILQRPQRRAYPNLQIPNKFDPQSLQRNHSNNSKSMTVNMSRVQFFNSRGSSLHNFDFSPSDLSCEMEFVTNHESCDLNLKATRSSDSQSSPFNIQTHEIEGVIFHKARFNLGGIVLKFFSHFKVIDRMKHWNLMGIGELADFQTPDTSILHDACFLELHDEQCLSILERIANVIAQQRSQLSDENVRTLSKLFLPPASNPSDNGPNDDRQSNSKQAPSPSLPCAPPSASLLPTPSSWATSPPLKQSTCQSNLPVSWSTRTNPPLKLKLNCPSRVHESSDFQALSPKSQHQLDLKDDAEVPEATSPKPDHFESRSGQALPSKPDPRQQLLNGMTKPRYNTRSCQSQNPAEPPFEARPDRVPGSSSNGLDSDIVLVWPFEDDRYSSSVAITNGDLKRLGEGEFLNDTLIEFGLKWELSEIEKHNPEVVSSIHLFNSFFFQKLSGHKSAQKSTPAEDAKEAYAGVRKWTKGLDVFKKDYLVIPINEHMHWYFIIVSNPGKLLEPQIQIPVTNLAAPSLPSTRTRRSQKIISADKPTSKKTSCTPEESKDGSIISSYFDNSSSKPCTPPAEDIDGTEEVEASSSKATVNAAVDRSTRALEHMDLDENSFAQDEGANPEASIGGIKNDDMELPYVLTLDSLGSSHRPQSQTILRYLINEAEDKLHQTLPESLTKTVNIKKVPVPEQPNYCDCGLYLIHAFKTFFSKPALMLRWILDNTKKRPSEQWQNEIHSAWNAAGAAQARQTLREQLHNLIPQYQAKVRLRKAAAEDKKLEPTRIRKLSCTEVPSIPTLDSAKKPRLSYFEESQPSFSSPKMHDGTSRSTTSYRFLEKSFDSEAQKDELYTQCTSSRHSRLTSSTVPINKHRAAFSSLNSPSPASNRTVGMVIEAKTCGNNLNDPNTCHEVEIVESDGPPTPDLELMVKGIKDFESARKEQTSPQPPSSLPTKGAHPILAPPINETRMDLNDDTTNWQSVETCVPSGRVPSDCAMTPPGNPDYDGELLEGDGNSTTPDINSESSSLTDISIASIQQARPGPKSKEINNSREKNPTFTPAEQIDHANTPSSSAMNFNKNSIGSIRTYQRKKLNQRWTSSFNSSHQKQTSKNQYDPNDNYSGNAFSNSEPHHSPPNNCDSITRKEGNSDNPLMVDD